MADEPTCGTCFFWTGERKAPRKKAGPGKCAAPVPMPDLPLSIRGHINFYWPPPRNTMWRDEPANFCPTFSPMVPVRAA